MGERRIVIVGFMGCGKTTVAEALARRLGCNMIDLDSFITERESRSPAEIIQQDGEPSFRQIETQALSDVLKNNKMRVIGLGGGTWTIEQNRALIAQDNCFTIWLDAPFELCWRRITSSGTNRPLAPDEESAKRLYTSRRPIYELATLRLDASVNSVADNVALVDRRLSREASGEAPTD